MALSGSQLTRGSGWGAVAAGTFSAKADTDLTNPFGLNSILSSRGLGLTCTLSSAATGVASAITSSHGIITDIQDTFGVTSTIDNTGKGVDGS